METAFTDRNLIFIVSQPRAGSTLLQALLAGGEGVHTTAEPWLMLHPLYALRETGHTADYDAAIAARALQEFLNGLDEGTAAYDAAVRGMALELYGRACRQAGKSIFLDKTPRYYKILPDLNRVFPAARFIILLRNPAAVLSSILRTWVDGAWPRFYTFRDDLLAAPGMLTEYLAGADERTTVVHYEALVQSPEATLRFVCGRLDVPFHTSMLEYGRRPLPAGRYGDPTGIQQHARPSAATLDAWREHARDPQIHHLICSYLDELGPEVVARMGYDYAELRTALAGIPKHPGVVEFTWQHLMKPDKTRGDTLRLIVRGGRRNRQPGRMVRQIIRLFTERPI